MDAVILTGGTETALQMLRLKPDMNLLAETGGKNAATLTALGDRELAISHVIHSAFSHSGQKCSATSLLLVEEETCRDPKFKETFCDAARSLEVGSAWDLRNRMGPLIRPPSGSLERGLKELEPGESWAVMPRRMDDNPCLYSPGVKWDVRPGSFTHLTEIFGPVLGVMRVKNLDDALGLIRQTGYGLTAGSALRCRSECRESCSGRRPRPESTWRGPRSWLRAGWSCSGTSASRASASITTATATWASGKGKKGWETRSPGQPGTGHSYRRQFAQSMWTGIAKSLEAAF